MTSNQHQTDPRWPGRSDLLQVFWTYLGVSYVGHLLWEFLQLPLYTIWSTGTAQEIVFAVLHCAAGDVLIATSALFAALAVCWVWSLPRRSLRCLAALIILIGIGYTAFSEWLNVYVRHSWTYSPMMPLLHIGAIGFGLSPLLQWIVVPSLVLAFVSHRLSWLRRSPLQ